MDKVVRKTLETIAEFYDTRKVGNVGPLGFRRSSDLKILLSCLNLLHEQGLLRKNCSFLDMGCADGRINVLMSYFVRASVGIELDEWTLDEYAQLKGELDLVLESMGLLLPPHNIHLFHGDACDSNVHRLIEDTTGIGFSDFDFFYTYLVMHEEFSHLISAKAKPGAIFMLYGVDKVLPRYEGLKLMSNIGPMEGILALYRKD